MTIKYNGNVGIGTDDPQAKLTIGPGSSLLFADNRGNSSARNWAIRVNNTTEGDFQLGNTGTNTGGLPDFYANPSHAKITLKNSGYVGIGTTSPSHNLHVNGNIRGTKVFSQSNSPSIDGNYRNYYYINDAYHGWGKILSRNAGQVNGWAVAEFGRKDGGITPFAYRLRGNGNFQFQFSSNQLRIKKNPSSGMSTQWDVLAI
jgi:hypothetical protein